MLQLAEMSGSTIAAAQGRGASSNSVRYVMKRRNSGCVTASTLAEKARDRLRAFKYLIQRIGRRSLASRSAASVKPRSTKTFPVPRGSVLSVESFDVPVVLLVPVVISALKPIVRSPPSVCNGNYLDTLAEHSVNDEEREPAQ